MALTFDDGPGPAVPEILTVLRSHHVHATFFDTGSHEATYPDMVRAIAADGDLLADHTWDHRYPTQISGGWTTQYLTDQITRTAEQQEHLTGKPTCLFRPPGGLQQNVLATTRAQGMSEVMWSVDSLDWQQPDHLSDAATLTIMRNATATHGQRHPIVLMHAAKASHEPEWQVGSYRGNTVAALPAVISWYQDHGYRFVDLLGNS